MGRELQLELLEKLTQLHVKNSLLFNLQYKREDLLAMGLDSLSKCLAEKVNPDVLIEKLEWEAREKINEYSQFWAKRIVKDYEEKLRD